MIKIDLNFVFLHMSWIYFVQSRSYMLSCRYKKQHCLPRFLHIYCPFFTFEFVHKATCHFKLYINLYCSDKYNRMTKFLKTIFVKFLYCE